MFNHWLVNLSEMVPWAERKDLSDVEQIKQNTAKGKKKLHP